MRSKKGFTLIELMVVVLIVAVLAAVLVPLLTARIEAARWSEGRAALGQIATCVRAYGAEAEEMSSAGLPSQVYTTGTGPGYLEATDLEGRYFVAACYTFTEAPNYDATTGALEYEIQCDTTNCKRSDLFTRVTSRTLNHLGEFDPP